MRGYGDLKYFEQLDFLESLNCYIHLVKDLENELTIEKLKLLIGVTSAKENETKKPEISPVDDYVEQYF